MNSATSNDKKKDLVSFGCIAMAIAGLLLGILFPKPLADAFSFGTLLGLGAFLLSLTAVKDRGSNVPAMLAFGLSFVSMSASIFFSSMLG